MTQQDARVNGLIGSSSLDQWLFADGVALRKIAAVDRPWLILDVTQTMVAVFYVLVYLAIFVLMPTAISLLGAPASLIGVIIIASAIYHASRRLAAVGLPSLVHGAAAMLLLGPYALYRSSPGISPISPFHIADEKKASL